MVGTKIISELGAPILFSSAVLKNNIVMFSFQKTLKEIEFSNICFFSLHLITLDLWP